MDQGATLSVSVKLQVILNLEPEFKFCKGTCILSGDECNMHISHFLYHSFPLYVLYKRFSRSVNQSVSLSSTLLHTCASQR